MVQHRSDQGCTDSPKFQEAPQNSRRQKGYMKQVPYWGPTDIVRCHRTKFSQHDDLSPGVSAPLGAGD